MSRPQSQVVASVAETSLDLCNTECEENDVDQVEKVNQIVDFETSGNRGRVVEGVVFLREHVAPFSFFCMRKCSTRSVTPRLRQSIIRGT